MYQGTSDHRTRSMGFLLARLLPAQAPLHRERIWQNQPQPVPRFKLCCTFRQWVSGNVSALRYALLCTVIRQKHWPFIKCRSLVVGRIQPQQRSRSLPLWSYFRHSAGPNQLYAHLSDPHGDKYACRLDCFFYSGSSDHLCRHEWNGSWWSILSLHACRFQHLHLIASRHDTRSIVNWMVGRLLGRWTYSWSSRRGIRRDRIGQSFPSYVI